MEDKLLFLREVASFIGANHLLSDIEALESKMANNCPLVLPLVGDFSSGKTSLINALTDSRALETATIPTTASIFEVHFGSNECYAVIHQSDGTDTRVDDIATLKNSKLSDVPVVDVYDTSTQVPSSLILVDTPGLQSTDPKHREILTNFLPQADGILLLIDINAQLSASLSNYIKSMQLSQKQMFVVVTKADTKSDADVEASIENIVSQLRIDRKNIVAVSAINGKIEPLIELLQRVREQKEEILSKVNQQRVHNVVQRLLQQIDSLLRSQSFSSNELFEMLKEAEDKQRNVHRTIERLLYSIKDNITEICRKGERTFEDTVAMQLEQIVANARGNYDEEAKIAINSCSAMVIDSICSEIMDLLRQESRRVQGTENGISLRCLEDVDLSAFKLDGLNYNLHLNTVGHEHDGKIATGLKIAAAAAYVAATGGSGAGTAATMIGDAVGDVAEQIVESPSENGTSASTIERIMSEFQTVDQEDQHVGQQFGSSKGIITEIVGLAGDATWAKTQRQRAVHNYIDSTLMPSFRQKMVQNITALLNQLRASIQEEMQSTLDELKSTIETLRQEKEQQQDAYNKRIEQIKQYKSQLGQL